MGEFKAGRHSYGVIKVLFSGSVTCGNFCSIAGDVTAVMEGHDPGMVTTYPFAAKRLRRAWGPNVPEGFFTTTKGDIHIGSDVWIGQEAMILSGVTIGHGAVIGARALITKDVAPYTVVGGVPAVRLRQRFPDGIIDRILAIAWWDWPDDLIWERMTLLVSRDYHKLLELLEE
jgi:hypothetical protein